MPITVLEFLNVVDSGEIVQVSGSFRRELVPYKINEFFSLVVLLGGSV